MSSMISALAWVKRGASQRHPKKYELNEQELQRVSSIAKVEFEDAKKELERAQKLAQSVGQEEGEEDEWEDEQSDEDDPMDEDGPAEGAEKTAKSKSTGHDDDMAKYNLDTYDDEESTSTAMGAFSNIKGLTFYRSNDEDPYITMKGGEEEEAEEREEMEIYPTDNLIIAARTEDDVSQIDTYVYDDSEQNLYVHHDFMLPSFPLCLEWLDFRPSSSSASSAGADDTGAAAVEAPGNFVAVGTFEPEIEIWSLDTVDGLFPDAILGRKEDKADRAQDEMLEMGKKKRRKTKRRAPNAEHHVDAVLGLSWNRTHRNLLASASADATVKLWDLSRPSGAPAVRSFSHHTDKVQAVQWNSKEPTVLLTGGFDKVIRVFDSRAPDSGVGTGLMADVEAVRWNPWESHGVLVSLENGLVQSYDARTLPTASSTSPFSGQAQATFTLSAHDTAVSAMDVNPHIPGCIITGGTDKTVKIWNVDEPADGGAGKRNISLVASRDLGVGKVFAAQFSPDDPMTIAVAGSKAKLQVWNALSNAGVRKAFGDRLRAAGKEGAKAHDDGEVEGAGGVVGVAEDESEESEDEEGGAVGDGDEMEE